MTIHSFNHTHHYTREHSICGRSFMMTIFDVLFQPLLIVPSELNGKDVSDWEFEDDGRFGIGHIFVR